MRFHTVGHADRSLAELIGLLHHHGITRLADVRRYPASRKHPWFHRMNLEACLPERDVAYRWFEDLGGRVGRQEDVPEETNGAWENQSFHNYADHALTERWQRTLDALEAWARDGETAVMCAERVWWRCHRRVVADHLVARGHTVVHILDTDRAPEHELSEFGRVREDGLVVYPG